MGLNIRDGDQWKGVASEWVRDNGSWKTVSNLWQRDNDQWKRIPFGSTVPTAPSNLSALAASSDTVDLTWSDNSTSESEWGVWRDGSLIDTPATTDMAGTSQATYTDSGLVTGTTYCYRVDARNTAGASTKSNQDCAVPQSTDQIEA